MPDVPPTFDSRRRQADRETHRVYLSLRDVTNLHVDRERLQCYADLLERTQGELKAAIDELTKVSSIDQLTGLFDRRAFEARAIEEFSRSERSGLPVAVAMLDIDHFKSVNDTHGHPTGDAVLRDVSRRIDAARRHQDVVARYGGEEFVAIFPETTLDEALVAVERLALSVSARPISVGSLQIPIRPSGGLTAGVASPETNILNFVQTADRALLRAKAEGRDRIETAALAEHVLSSWRARDGLALLSNVFAQEAAADEGGGDERAPATPERTAKQCFGQQREGRASTSFPQATRPALYPGVARNRGGT